MFVTVKFGEKEEGIFNPHCRCITLLSNIRERCCPDDVEVDLSDESGNLKNLRESPQRYADEMLDDRETLVLLRVDRADSGDYLYTPLLNDIGHINETFLAQLASGSAQDQSTNRRSKNGSKKSKLRSEGRDSQAKNGKSPIKTRVK